MLPANMAARVWTGMQQHVCMRASGSLHTWQLRSSLNLSLLLMALMAAWYFSAAFYTCS